MTADYVNDIVSESNSGKMKVQDRNWMNRSVTTDSNSEYSSSKKPSLRRRILGYSALGIVCIGIMSAGTFLGILSKNPYFLKFMGGVIQHPFNVMADYTPDKQFPPDKRHSMDVLLLGADADYKSHIDHPVVDKKSHGRSDTMMLAHVDFDKNTVAVMSIPRDTRVRIPEHRGIWKINAAYSVGGPDLACSTVKSVFSIDPDYYININLDGFQQIVDAVGGVELDVEKKMDYDDKWGNLHVHLKPGMQHMTGYQAMGFVRVRKLDSDIHRAARQQQFLAAFKSQVKSPTSFMKLPTVLNAITNNLGTNMTKDQVLALANFMRQLPHESITQLTMPCIEGPKFVECDIAKTETLLRKYFLDSNPTAVVRIDVPSPGTRVAMRTRSRRGSRRHPLGTTIGTPAPTSNEEMSVQDDDGAPLNEPTSVIPSAKDTKPAVPSSGDKPPPATAPSTPPNSSDTTGSGQG